MTITQLRQSARQIWESALQRADPSECILQAVHVGDGVFTAGGREYTIRGKIIVIGAGKASAKMAQTIEESFGAAISGGLVVTKYGHGQPTRRVEIVEAGHPIPDAPGMLATQRLKQLLSHLTAKDIVLCLISGGASALWPAPAEGITLDEKQDVTEALLRAGATIRELNAVRKHLSAIKGGQLARWAAPGRVVSLIMSDVIGDPLDFIGSGPTAPDTTSFSDALAIIQKYGIDRPESIVLRLESGARGRIPETPKPGDPVFENVDNWIIANNRILIDAAKEKAETIGFHPMILGTEVAGEAKDIAGFFAAISREIARTGNPIKPPACILAGGETTVTVRGNGLGGRNQEMALAWAIAMSSRHLPVASCFASIASDGTDGPTLAAGGLVDPFTCSRAVKSGLSPLRYLRSNDSSSFLKATGDLIVTGPTKTNLMDLQILLVG